MMMVTRVVLTAAFLVVLVLLCGMMTSQHTNYIITRFNKHSDILIKQGCVVIEPEDQKK